MAAFLLALLCSPSQAQTTPSDAQILQMLAARVDLQKQGTGIVVAIAEPKGDHVLAYGTYGLNDKRRVDEHTVYDIGSITKVFTALILSDMVQHHEVELDDPVAKLLPGAVLPSRNGRAITLADLATHTSGLPLRPGNLPAANDPANPYAGYTRAELLDFLAGYKLTRDPGTQYDYSNVGFGLLGTALSEHAGQSYADLIRGRITAPLGMNETRIAPTDAMAAHAPVGYDAALKPVPHWDMGALASAGSLRSTADDLLKLLDVEIGTRSSPLAPALAAMTTTRRPGGMNPADSITLAWNIYRDDEHHEIVWKNGNVGGFRAFIGYDLAARRGVVALMNAQAGNGPDDIGLHILDLGYAVDLEVPRPHVEIALAPDALDRFVGRYRFSATDILDVSRKDDHLEIVPAPGQPTIEIYPESADSFFLKIINAQIRFEAVTDGHATRAIWHQSGHDQTGERIAP